MLASASLLYDKNDSILDKSLVSTFIISNNLTLTTIVVGTLRYIEYNKRIGIILVTTSCSMYMSILFIVFHQYYKLVYKNSVSLTYIDTDTNTDTDTLTYTDKSIGNNSITNIN